MTAWEQDRRQLRIMSAVMAGMTVLVAAVPVMFGGPLVAAVVAPLILVPPWTAIGFGWRDSNRSRRTSETP